MLNVSSSALRQWENAGLVQPQRTRSGYRTYSLYQVNLLKHIQNLRVEKGMNIDAIRHFIGRDESKRAASVKAPPASDRSIGRKLRYMRQERNVTLMKASKETGLSASFLSCLERGLVHASVATLQKLSVYYKSSVLSLFDGEEINTKQSNLVKPGQRKKVSSEPGIEMELLATGNVSMEPHIFHLAPGTSSGGSYYHEGEEFIYMLSGVCEIWLDELEHYLLHEGDCLYFSSTQTHRWKNPGKTKAMLLWVNTPPTF